ncbi:sulfotransferase 4A1 [Malurus melanocephalus]|uniref:sulfotransferase 4A1 n=1 Tax=Malurus melanocephalus TaxID=175006 RepID=UPI002549A073|nr:sulfotransferase 4A1 [Malurus melanocephalus]
MVSGGTRAGAGGDSDTPSAAAATRRLSSLSGTALRVTRQPRPRRRPRRSQSRAAARWHKAAQPIRGHMQMTPRLPAPARRRTRSRRVRSAPRVPCPSCPSCPSCPPHVPRPPRSPETCRSPQTLRAPCLGQPLLVPQPRLSPSPRPERSGPEGRGPPTALPKLHGFPICLKIRTVIQSVLSHCLVYAGTGLLQEVVYLVSQGADPDEIGLMNIDEQLPVLEYPQPGLDIIKELTSPRLIKSHLPYRFLPSDLHNGNSKVIYMARNPKDLVVSYYQFHRSLRTMSYRGTFQEFCRRFMNDKLGYGSWFEHVQEFWEHHMDSNVLFLKYEDMHKDLATMVEQLVRFLGVSYDKAQLETMVEHCHQLIDQCCNAEALPVGRGRVGLWKDIFTVSMNEKFDLVYKQKMGKCDLTFDFYL